MYDPKTLEKDILKLHQSSYFDPDWYTETYKDVAALNMDPAVHYLKYGAPMLRDPGPRFCAAFYAHTHPVVISEGINPLLHHLKKKGPSTKIQPPEGQVLRAAFNVSLVQGAQKGVELAEQYLGENFRYSSAILKANHATSLRQESKWLENLNAYLAHFDLEPVQLKPGPAPLLERLSTGPLDPVSGETPLITVIMPAWNAQDTVLLAARSILQQTWQQIELIIVDDASTDRTLERLKVLEQEDSRVQIIHNNTNSGPYVSKNIALLHATGDYITGHDADDWAHPQRLENHMKAAMLGDTKYPASVTYMLRMQPNGFFGFIGAVNGFSIDGAARRASISCLFERKLLIEKLGFWDSVRFGADSEMIGRTEAVLGNSFGFLPQISMICLDAETSLTNHPEFGVDRVNGLSDVRTSYRDSWKNWHKEVQTSQDAYLPFVQNSRYYDAPDSMKVPVGQVRTLYADFSIRGHANQR